MWDVLEPADSELLLRCLRIVDVYPEEARPEGSSWFSGKEFIPSTSSRMTLQDRLAEKIKGAVNAKRLDRVENERAGVRLVADKLKVAYDPIMATEHVEDAIFTKVSSDKLPLLRLLVLAGRHMACLGGEPQARSGNDTLRSLLDEVMIRQADKDPLYAILERTVAHDELEAACEDLDSSDNGGFALLGIVWTVANVDDSPATAEQRFFHDALAQKLNVPTMVAEGIRQQVRKNLGEAHARLLAEAKDQKISPLGLEEFSSAVGSAATSLVALGLAEAAGFGLFTGAVVALHAFGLLIGIPFAFGAYTALTWVLGVLTGPVGWVGVPLAAGGSVLVHRWLTSPAYRQLLDLIVVVASARERARSA
jgi:hypothetical protein